MKEKWKDVPGYEGRYQVSDMGRVKSTARGKDFILTPANADKNPRVILCDGNGKNLPLLVHRLVLLAFVGPSDLPARRRDGDNTNNRLTNLFYDGKGAPETPKAAVHLEADIENKILERLSEGVSQRKIAKEFGVVQSTVSRIGKRGRNRLAHAGVV